MLDPKSKEKLEKDDYEEILEKLARGRITKEKTILSRSYLDYVINELKRAGCIINEKLDVVILKEALQSGTVNIDIFNKPLWNVIEELNF